ncbi:MAG: hypothetical protein AAF744_02995 [Pseudomonadota bacterium]
MNGVEEVLAIMAQCFEPRIQRGGSLPQLGKLTQPAIGFLAALAGHLHRDLFPIGGRFEISVGLGRLEALENEFQGLSVDLHFGAFLSCPKLTPRICGALRIE